MNGKGKAVGLSPTVALQQAYEKTGELKGGVTKQIETLWELGEAMHNDPSGASIREYTHLLQTSQTKVRQAQELYSKYATLDDLRNVLYIEQPESITGFFSMLNAKEKKVVFKDLFENIRNKVADVLRTVKQNPNDEDAYKSLEKLRNRINRYVPLTNEFSDQYYLRYSYCACCGTDNMDPEEGFELIPHPSYRHVKIPVCLDCMEIEATVNDEVVMLLYANYALNLDKTLDKLL